MFPMIFPYKNVQLIYGWLPCYGMWGTNHGIQMEWGIFFSMKTGFFNLIFNPRIKCVMLTPDEKMFHGFLGGVLSKYFPNSNHRILHWYPLNQDPQRDDVPYVDTHKIESSLN